MAQLMDHMHFMTQEIGPRPAGTEEERQTALYITEQFQKEAGFTSNIEDFSLSSNPDLANAILCGVIIIASILAMIFPVLAIFMFVLAAVAAAVFVLEMLDRPLLSRFLAHGESQNVIAKYQPNPDEAASGRTRSRKLIVIAHYDTGRVTPPLVETLRSTGLPLPIVCMGGAVAAALFLLFRVFVATSGGVGLIVLNVLTVISLLICLPPILKFVLMRTAAYSEGANNNATGASALIELARRISRGSVSEADLASGEEGVVIHGEDAARSAGLIPEGAQIRYEAEQLVPPSDLGEYDEEERLLAAKAAIAALTGKPVERHVYGSVADNLVGTRAHEADENEPEPMEPLPEGERRDGLNTPTAADLPEPPEPEPESPVAEGFKNAPSWFVAAQRNARRSTDSEAGGEIHRSRFTEAMEHAESERRQRAQEAQRAEQERLDAERRAREEEARAVLEQRMGMATTLDAEAEEGLQSSFSDGDTDMMAPVRVAAEPASKPEPEPAAAAPAATEEVASPDKTHMFPSYAQLDAEAAAAAAGEAGKAPERAETIQPAEISATPRRSISLPELDSSPAPRRMVSDLPPIAEDPAAQASEAPALEEDPNRADKLRNLRTSVPSLSGVIRMQNETRKQVASSLPSVVNVPSLSSDISAPADAEAPAVDVPAPVDAPADEAVDYDMEVPVRDTFVFDDDSEMPQQQRVEFDYDDYDEYDDFEEDFGESSFQEPRNAGEVEMPKSRAGGFFNRFRRKQEEDLGETPQEWLNIDEDFDARSVGRARGSWESFRDDSIPDDDQSAPENGASGRGWEGGSYSSRMSLGHVNMRSGEDAEADEVIPDEPPEAQDARDLTGEIEQIYHFRNPSFNTEIWFVAIGADDAGHDGVKAFLNEHRNELRGSMAIEIESLGAGALSAASQEGKVRKVNASSRIKRITRDAVSKTGIALGEENLSGSDSISSILQKAGFQAMHLFGAENGRQALKGSADDVLQNVDEYTLDEHVNFLFELLKYR